LCRVKHPPPFNRVPARVGLVTETRRVGNKTVLVMAFPHCMSSSHRPQTQSLRLLQSYCSEAEVLISFVNRPLELCLQRLVEDLVEVKVAKLLAPSNRDPARARAVGTSGDSAFRFQDSTLEISGSQVAIHLAPITQSLPPKRDSPVLCLDFSGVKGGAGCRVYLGSR
jgi:hypothetical protein